MTVLAGVLAYDPNKVKPGWIAFFVVMTLLVATFLLWRSMNHQLKKIRVPPRASFEPDNSKSPTSPASPRVSRPADKPETPPSAPYQSPSDGD